MVRVLVVFSSLYEVEFPQLIARIATIPLAKNVHIHFDSAKPTAKENEMQKR